MTKHFSHMVQQRENMQCTCPDMWGLKLIYTSSESQRLGPLDSDLEGTRIKLHCQSKVCEARESCAQMLVSKNWPTQKKCRGVKLGLVLITLEMTYRKKCKRTYGDTLVPAALPVCCYLPCCLAKTLPNTLVLLPFYAVSMASRLFHNIAHRRRFAWIQSQ